MEAIFASMEYSLPTPSVPLETEETGVGMMAD
jgi:hypothetical protein